MCARLSRRRLPQPKAGGQRLVEEPPLLLPHLTHLLRAGTRPLRLAAAEQRRRDQLEEMLLLPRVQPARDPLPEVPPLGAPLHGTRVAQLAAQHAPETAHAELVAGVAE